MIWTNKQRAFEIQVRKGRNIVVYTVGARHPEEAEKKVIEKYNVKKQDIVEVSK